MTEEQYIRANTTKWDKIKTNFFQVPAGVFALGILYFMFFSTSDQMSKGFFGVVLLLGLPAVYWNIKGATKIRRLKMEYKAYMNDSKGRNT